MVLVLLLLLLPADHAGRRRPFPLPVPLSGSPMDGHADLGIFFFVVAPDLLGGCGHRLPIPTGVL